MRLHRPERITMGAELSYSEKRHEILDTIGLLFRAGVISHSGHAGHPGAETRSSSRASQTWGRLPTARRVAPSAG